MKLFFSDVDNTLVKKGKTFSPEIKSTIKTVLNAGDEFVLCSGRPLSNLINVAEQLKADNIKLNYVCGFNGGSIYDVNKQQIIYQNGLDLNQVSEVANVLNELKLDYLLYDDQSIITTNMDNEWAIFESELNDITLRPLTNLIPSVKVLGLVDPSQMEQKLPLIQKALPNYTVINSTPFFIEITKNGVNKGTGLLNLQQKLAIDLADCYVFGDAMNDYEMFKVAVNRICVGNAVEELKVLATEITDDVTENGVANYLNKLYLK